MLKRHQASKRIKLVKELVNPVTGDSVTPSDYISSVRALLNRTADANENDQFESFKVFLDSTYILIDLVILCLKVLFLLVRLADVQICWTGVD